MRRFFLLRFGRLRSVNGPLRGNPTILLFTIYHGFKSLYSPNAKPSYVLTRAIVRAVRNAFLLGSLWAMLPLLFFSNASAGRSSHHRVPLCRDAGGRCFRVCQHPRGGDCIHNAYCYWLRDSHRTQRRDGVHTRQCLDGQLHHGVAEGSFGRFGADRHEGQRTGSGREEGQARPIDGPAESAGLL